jgi:DNA polymerase-3 subunit epsilon
VRDLIVCDLETTGLNTAQHWPLEVAAINILTGEELHFVPFIPASALGGADPQALQVNRYYERGTWKEMLPDLDANRRSYDLLRDMLQGNTLGGSNPRFDAAILQRFVGEPWHYRLADLSAYAAGALGVLPGDLPGLDNVCHLLGVTNEDPHSALGDARATAECFRRLVDRQTDKILKESK